MQISHSPHGTARVVGGMEAAECLQSSAKPPALLGDKRAHAHLCQLKGQIMAVRILQSLWILAYKFLEPMA